MLNRIRELRKELCLTQEELGEYLDISKSNICLLEQGDRGLREIHIKNLCDLFAVTSDYLLGKSDIGLICTYSNGAVLMSREQYQSLVDTKKAHLVRNYNVSIRYVESLPKECAIPKNDDGLIYAIQKSLQTLDESDLNLVLNFVKMLNGRKEK